MLPLSTPTNYDRIHALWAYNKATGSAGGSFTLPKRCTSLVLLVLLGGCGSEQEDLTQANDYLIEARQAITEKDTDKAMEALNQSLKIKPTVWSYFERAQIHLKNADEQVALQDCEAALEILPESSEVLWLKGEIEKPVDKRFQGQDKYPPRLRG